MKKTLIALMAMAGAAFGADYTTEVVWTLDFGTENGSDGYDLTGTMEKQGKFWDTDKTAVAGGTQSNANQRVHMAGGIYGSWDTDFQVELTLTLDDTTISASNSWPVFAEIAGNGTSLRFGPYTEQNNTVSLDGVNVTKGKNNLVSVAPGGTYTITLTKIGKEVTVAVNGVDTGYGTLADSVSGNITDIALGGNTSTNYRINEVVHSISWSKVTVVEPSPSVPEPTTATLSLLALAGLAARRRRR